MHLAHKQGIAGTLYYSSENSIILELTGSEEDLLHFIENCRHENYISEINILSSKITRNKPGSFVILNHIE